MTLAPSAKITITIAATPLSVNSTIQGSTDPAAATKADHVLTGVVTSHSSSQFQATPTGTTANLPAVAAKATLDFSTNSTSDISFALPTNNTSSEVQTGRPVDHVRPGAQHRHLHRSGRIRRRRVPHAARTRTTHPRHTWT